VEGEISYEPILLIVQPMIVHDLIPVFDAAVPVGTCTLAHPTLMWVSIVGDIVTTVGFYAIAAALVILARRRADLRSDWRIPIAGLVLAVSGSTHLVEVWSMWNDAYSEGGLLTLITAIASIATVYVAWQLVAKLVELPSKRSLDEEIEKRKISDEAMKVTRVIFEETVTRHASEISAAMRKLSRLASIVDNSQDAIIGIESNGEVWEWNPSAERLFGFREDEVLGCSVSSLLSSNGWDMLGWASQALTLPSAATQVEVQCRRKDGSELPVWLCISPVLDSANGEPGVSIIARDMSEKKLAQERLSQSLTDKELLLKEVHHRVKNNLQIICSLLRLQSGYVPEGAAREMFRNSEERVKCMALVHEKLYRSESLSRVSFNAYISELTKQLVRSHIPDPNKVHLELDLDSVDLSIDKAVPSGLILNELIGNAIEYGCGGDGVLSLSVVLRKKAHMVELVVSDHGVGMPSEVDLVNPTSLGLRVVNTLCKQLNGKLAVGNDGGAVVRLEFPLEKPEAAREHTVDSAEAIA
jgi:PAS domain S-box-containing protein